ncbi:hypothetical protein EAS62_35990 [Bradyrhizobium zhanjiangense]|uniref:DNA-binding protein n=1 Tax=Bradyrhizobium zhanjiangense TaxID=1325107 RepID=A0ABY0DB57_9BRAD|nr:hypothetical protein EAS62_35990 [Bradyrhizobium zhanjiangense]
MILRSRSNFASARRSSTLPLSLPPRGLSRAQAAEYIGVSPSTFDKMVADGDMPQLRSFASVGWRSRNAISVTAAVLVPEFMNVNVNVGDTSKLAPSFTIMVTGCWSPRISRRSSTWRTLLK